ncbi:MAG: dihydrofolate reductase family protein [Actinomycetes bacterium]
MSVLANLVLGSDGSTTLDGSSKSLSSANDRRRFHELRALASVILIGGNTARTEPYATTPVPLVVITKSGLIPESVRANPIAQIWELDPISAIARARDEFGENVLVEGGMKLIQELLIANKIDELYLTLSDKSGGENIYDLSALTRDFTVESSEKTGGETFLKLIRN